MDFFNCDWSRQGVSAAGDANFSCTIDLGGTGLDGNGNRFAPAGIGNGAGDEKLDIHIVDATENDSFRNCWRLDYQQR